MKCIILEDEKAAQEILEGYLEKTPFTAHLGTYESGLDIPPKEIQAADMLFLDVQLPELNGLQFLKTIVNPPKIIVTTAFTDYAIEAFEEAVVDYLVKPFSYERFFKAVTRVRTQLLAVQKEKNQQLFLYADKTIYAILAQDILYIKAEVDYVNVVTTTQEILILDSLRNWTQKLKRLRFVQVHRSYLVNITQVSKVYGNQVFIADTAIPIGKSYKDTFLNMMK
ncbi:LytTR family DNA-binding domain-containing protein [uncultured Croceitalea sp.]|uniref:LytR/AlgR family response regulator transcription factor n=1 Tax=uncultured Croceitalea sp. TaxID=1798908 RepID=UPI00330605E3